MFNIYTHFVISGFSNSYFVANEETKEAFVVDPSHFDGKLLTKVENGGYKITTVLVTHGHFAHIQGLRTLLKIYDAQVFYGGNTLKDVKFTPIEDGQILKIIGSEVKAIQVNGHSRDSFCYLFNNNLFTGDVMEAGRIGNADTPFLRTRLIDNIKEKILPLEGNYIIYPGHGPLTTLNIEREYLQNLKISQNPKYDLRNEIM